MTEEDVRKELRAWAKGFKRQLDAAAALGVSTAYFSQMVNGVKRPNDAALKALGIARAYEKMVCYSREQGA